MSIEDKLKEIGIKKMLVVDDRSDHIDAAKECFSQYKQIQVDYAFSGIMAKELIKMEYEGQKYDLVLSDMQMEDKKSGQAVVTEASKHQALGIVVTSRGPGSHGDKHWGEGTKMICPGFEYVVESPKSQPDSWRMITEKTFDYLQGDGKRIFDSVKRYSQYVGKPSGSLSDLLMQSYDFGGD